MAQSKAAEAQTPEYEYMFPTLGGIVVRAASLEEAEKQAIEQAKQLEIINEAGEADKE